MSALLLKKQADYLVHDSYTVETEDHEDHTFNGVMFDVEVLDRRPVQALVVDSIHVRGGLGQMSVWCVEGGRRGVEEKPNAWTQAFSRHVNASWRDFTSLKLEPPLILLPGKTYGLYVHSADQGDDGVVYDNQRDEICHEDDYIRVFPGLAHLSPDPFGADGPWWGSPWRRRRAFVGKLSYGARYVLWRPVPAAHTRFDPTFRRGVVAAFYALTMGWGGLARCGNQPVLAPSSGDGPASPRHRASVASMAWRSTRLNAASNLISTQVAVVSAYNTSTSSGQLAFYAERQAKRGLVCLALANSPEFVRDRRPTVPSRCDSRQ